MGAAKQIRMAILDKDLKQTDIAEALGKPLQSFYNMLCRDTMSYAFVQEVADVLGCDVMLVDRESGKMY